MRKWIEEILKANKTPREIFSLLSEEEKKDLINEFDKRMGYKFDPDSPGFLRGHVLADDGNMKKLLTITRELKEDFDKEDYAHIYYLGRSSRWFIRMLEFLSTPVDKKVYAQIPFSGGWYEDKAGSDELVETKDKPEAVQVAVYGENLSRIGFNPQDIIKRREKP